MADNDDVTGMTPDELLDAARFDEERFDDVSAALAEVSFLNPSSETSEPIPDWAWDRLSTAIGTEAAARAVAQHDNVVPLSRATETPPSSRSSRGMRWTGGLVAASVAVLAVTVGVQVMGGSSASNNVVAGQAPTITQTSAALKETTPFSADEAPAAAAPAAAGGASPAADARALGGPLVEQPAKLVVDSNTKYTEAGLSGQVTALLNRLGVHSAQEAALMPPQPTAMPVEDGFTSSWAQLRDCLSWLAKSPRAQALVVDRGTFEGADAGVVVVPASELPASVSPPPTATIESSMGAMDVWVVDPSCRHQVDSIMDYLPYTWGR